MPDRNGRSATQVRRDIEHERRQLTAALALLRGELGHATDVTAKLRGNLPLAVAGAFAVGFVLAGGVGATMRYFARRGREHTERARVGPLAVLGRR
ncbi:MAG TPA: hypothetical protein VFA88_00275 [Gaiellaceae bacterium]|nr:hypothetical protein [Gaiellaceae bacterium]